jgi:hypothetical protein
MQSNVPQLEMPTTAAQKSSQAIAAQGAALILKDPSAAADKYRLALKEEPTNRQFKGMLAFVLNKTGDEKSKKEAVSIWRDLAKGNDYEAGSAQKALARAGVTAAE